MDLFTVIFLVLGIYLLLSAIIFYALVNNIFIFRPRSYEMKLDDGQIIEKNLSDPEIRYYLIHRSEQGAHQRWVILFHSWGRDSARMLERGKVYLDRGYSLLAVDAPGHGNSQWVPYILGTDYAKYVEQICDIEDIRTPIVHGLSFGAIAALFFASNNSTRGLVAEALVTDFDLMYDGFFNSLRIPRFLFGWIPALIMRYNFDWEALAPKNLLPKLDIPIFLIHGENDTMFPLESHFKSNMEVLSDKTDVYSWVVEDSAHSKMARHANYRSKLDEFISVVS